MPSSRTTRTRPPAAAPLGSADPGRSAQVAGDPEANHLRFLREYQHLESPFGAGGFGAKADLFARFFGTPKFLIGQTALVGGWIAVNATHLIAFDLYPFILLNLAFSLQAAYAAPLILLAQTRQSDRDKAHADADAKHREALANAGIERQEVAAKQSAQLLELVEQNTELTRITQELSQGIKKL